MGENQNVERQIEVLREELRLLKSHQDELREHQFEMAATMHSIADRIGKMDRELFGNGKGPGLIVQMAKVQQHMRFGIWVATTIGGASLTALIGIFFGIIQG